MRYADPTSLVRFRPPTAPNLRASLHRLLAGRSSRALILVDALWLAQGPIGSASRVAWSLGFRNRFRLAAWLTRERLPPLHELAGWLSVLVWVDLSARIPISLCALALREGRDPAACYRLVQRVTGRPWGAVRSLGASWILSRFATRCDAVGRRRTPTPRALAGAGGADAVLIPS